MPAQLFNNFYKLVVKALKYTIARPIQRFHIEGRAKKYLGEESKYFMPAPRAIGSLSKQGISQYPHLENTGKFKSVAQRRQEAIASRNQKLLEASTTTTTTAKSISLVEANDSTTTLPQKSFSEIKQDDDLVIEASMNRLPVIRTMPLLDKPPEALASGEEGKDIQLVKSHRPLPKLVNLDLSDPASIWQVDKVPLGRLDLNKLQELMINKLADDEGHWTSKKISDVYNIKEEYAENIISYLKQIRIIISPHIKTCLDQTASNDPRYQATKDIIYVVDYTLRNETHRKFDETFLPTDQLEPEVQKVLEGGKVAEQLKPASKYMQPDIRLTKLYKRPEPLKLTHSINEPEPETKLLTHKDESKSIVSGRKLMAPGNPINKKRPQALRKENTAQDK